MVVEPALWKKAQEGEAAAGSRLHLGKSLCSLELHRDRSGGGLGGRESREVARRFWVSAWRGGGEAGRQHSTRQVGADCSQVPHNLISVTPLNPGGWGLSHCGCCDASPETGGFKHRLFSHRPGGQVSAMG